MLTGLLSRRRAFVCFFKDTSTFIKTNKTQTNKKQTPPKTHQPLTSDNTSDNLDFLKNFPLEIQVFYNGKIFRRSKLEQRMLTGLVQYFVICNLFPSCATDVTSQSFVHIFYSTLVTI